MADGLRWFFVRDGQREGPVAVTELVDLLLAGTLPPNALVWHTGLPQWSRASEVEEIARELPPPLPAQLAVEVQLAVQKATAVEPPIEELDRALGEPTNGPTNEPSLEQEGERRHHRHRHHRNHNRSRLTPVERRWLAPVILMVAGAVVGLWLLFLQLNAHP